MISGKIDTYNPVLADCESERKGLDLWISSLKK